MLDEMLKYHEELGSRRFTEQVMGQISKTDRTRQWILWLTGVVGAIFGLVGVAMLNDTAVQITQSVMQESSIWTTTLFATAILLLFVWILKEQLE